MTRTAQIKFKLLGLLLATLPRELRRRLSVHLGTPDLRWSLMQLRRFGLSPHSVLDVGAFKGDWARTFLKVFPDAHVTCLEPQDEPQADLSRLAKEYKNVRVIQTLVGRQVLGAVPFVDRGSGSSVLLPGDGTRKYKPMTTVDELIRSGQCEPPDFVKLDTQGYEIEILEGWTETLTRCSVLQCEVSLLPIVPDVPLLREIVTYLYHRQFLLFDITELIRAPSDGAVWQLDAIFCRADSPLRSQRFWDNPEPYI